LRINNLLTRHIQVKEFCFLDACCEHYDNAPSKHYALLTFARWRLHCIQFELADCFLVVLSSYIFFTFSDSAFCCKWVVSEILHCVLAPCIGSFDIVMLMCIIRCSVQDLKVQE